MKRSFFLAALLGVVVAFTSCIREDDFEMLRHPIHVQGEIDPNWGIPVAYGDVNMNDMIHMLSADYNGMLDTSNIITVVYETRYKDSVMANMSKTTHAQPFVASQRKDVTWYTKDTVLRINELDLDFFKDAEISQLMDSTKLALRQMWLKFDLGMWCQTDANLDQLFRARFDSVRIFYESRDGEVIDYEEAHHINIAMDHLNDTVHYLDSLNLAPIVNSVPRKVRGTIRMRVQVSSQIIPHNITDLSLEDIVDSLHSKIPSFTKIVYHSNARVEMPLIMQITNLPYSFDVDMLNGASLNIDSMLQRIDTGIHVRVEDSRFRLALENGLPFNLSLCATMLDANGNPLRDEMGRVVDDIFPLDTISAAQVRQIGTSGNYEASTPTKDTISVLLNNEKLEYFKEAKKLRIKVRMVSPDDPTNPAQKAFVAIKRNDFLKIKASVQVHPNLQFDMGLTNGGVLK